MQEKTVVQWQNSYSVGIKIVDEQHMELINLTNKLFNDCMEGQEQATSSFLVTIHEAVDYVGYHFSTEEKIMERVNYPDFANHKNEHADFVREVIKKVAEFNSGKASTPVTFVYYLKDWVLQHIAVCDKKMGDYLIAMHRNGELQNITLKAKKDKTTDRLYIQ